MKKSLLAVTVAAVLLSGCASMNPFSDKEPIDKVKVATTEAEFLTDNGGITIEYEKGDWVKITSVGVAQIQANRINSTEEAFVMAKLRAKRNLVEFITDDVHSKTGMDVLANTYITQNDAESANGDKVARNVSEAITSDANAMIKGVLETERDFEEDSRMVSVTLEVTKQSIQTAKNIKVMMEARLK